ncbi:MAG: hypothetical protein J6N74_07185 [Chryseobacterium sp.]|nr:hypothetical protein [Chryseobacterium sp.]
MEIPSRDGSGNPTASDGKAKARGIATNSRFPAPKMSWSVEAFESW